MVQDRTSQSSSLCAEILLRSGSQDFWPSCRVRCPGGRNASKDELTKLLEFAAVANVRLIQAALYPGADSRMGPSGRRPIIRRESLNDWSELQLVLPSPILS